MDATTWRQQLIPLRQAARRAGKRYAFVRKLVDDGELRAWKDGGTDEHPRLLVLPNDVDEAVRRTTLHVPRAAAVKRDRRPSRPASLHPRVRC